MSAGLSSQYFLLVGLSTSTGFWCLIPKVMGVGAPCIIAVVLGKRVQVKSLLYMKLLLKGRFFFLSFFVYGTFFSEGIIFFLAAINTVTCITCSLSYGNPPNDDMHCYRLDRMVGFCMHQLSVLNFQCG